MNLSLDGKNEWKNFTISGLNANSGPMAPGQ